MDHLEFDIYRSADSINKNEWNHLLEQSESSSFYHKIGWLAALEECVEGEPNHLLIKEHGNPIASLPGFKIQVGNTQLTRLVSVNPEYGNPVLTGNRKRALEAVLHSVKEVCSGTTISHTLRSDNMDQLALNELLQENSYRLSIGGKFALSLNRNWEEIFNSMHKDRRYNIRKARDTDAEVRELKLSQNVNDVFTDYVEKMEELEKEIWPRSFFQKLADRLDDDLLLLTVECDGQRRGYHLYLIDELFSQLRHFLVTVTRDDFDYYSGELMHEHAIRWALNKGFDVYDFGGNNPDFRSGGYKYKSQYGGTLYPTYRWEREYSWSFKLARTLYRKMR
jgi:predicted N-acyltransferase